jgi:hypothetical protein
VAEHWTEVAEATEMRDGARRVLGAVVIVFVLAGASFAGWAVANADDGPNCARLSERVAGIEHVDWDNGFTSSGPEWIIVLTNGVTRGDAPSRAKIARALHAEEGAYTRFRDALPEDLGPVADRLHAVALDVERGPPPGSGTDAQRDAAALQRFGLEACGFG